MREQHKKVEDLNFNNKFGSSKKSFFICMQRIDILSTLKKQVEDLKKTIMNQSVLHTSYWWLSLTLKSGKVKR